VGGAVLYDDGKFLFSHHATDPCGERLVNAFDLVRLHLYGGEDDDTDPGTPVNRLPSFGQMCELASKDGTVKGELAKQGKALVDEFDEPPDWHTQLEYDRKGHLKDTLENLVLILRNDEGLIGIAFNQHRDGIAVREAVPWDQLKPGWGDADQATLLTYISAEYRLHSPGKTKTALLAVAAERKFHPVRDFFNELPSWDGTERLDTLLVVVLGADDTPYVRAVTRKTLVAAVARTFEPGRKFDTALTFVGPRKIGKSTLYAKLGGKWYVESLSLADMHDGKRAAEKLQGCLIQEMAELTGMKKADIETIKAFLSRADDVYRASYGLNVENHPRQCIIVGTTNNDEGFLRDITGNRNFWVVKVTGDCPRKPWDLTQDEIDQIWAEALHYYKQGEQLHLPPELEDMAEEQQEAMMESDERTGAVIQYLDRLLPSNWAAMQPFDRQQWLDGGCFGAEELGTERRTEVCNAELWVECFGKRFSDMKKADSYDLKAIMRGIPGWERQKELKRFGCYGPQRYYKRVEQDA
jgi:predicted P-loop ATPase